MDSAISHVHESASPPPGLRDAATSVARRLIDAGFTAYFAGGCVRDHLMGLEPTDYDIATSARPVEVQKVFPRAQGVGESFGVMLVRAKSHVFQVATFRTDGVYSDFRRPDAVEFTDEVHDAQRRDFSINGLFENPVTGEVIDHVGGQADIKARLIRAIGDPAQRFREDHLRLLRAVRFAARFGFVIEAETAAAVAAAASDLRGVSRERIGQEIKKMMLDPNRGVAAWELQYLGLDSEVLGEPRTTVAPRVLARLPGHVPYPTALAAWMLDRHGGSSFTDRAVWRRWTDCLMLSNQEAASMTGILGLLGKLREQWRGLGVAAKKRLASSEPFTPAMAILQAYDTQAFVDLRREVLELARTGLSPHPFITGDDLIGQGFPPGPLFKRVLDAVNHAQLEGAVTGREEALQLARAVAEAEGRH